MIERVIWSLLASNQRLGETVGDRIHPIEAPHGSQPPYVVYEKLDVDYVATLSGTRDTATATFEITFWSKQYEQALAMAESVRQSFVRYRGVSHGVCVDLIRHEGETATTEEFISATEGPVYGVAASYEVSFAVLDTAHQGV